MVCLALSRKSALPALITRTQSIAIFLCTRPFWHCDDKQTSKQSDDPTASLHLTSTWEDSLLQKYSWPSGLICIYFSGNPLIRAKTGTFSLVMDSEIGKTGLAWLSKCLDRIGSKCDCGKTGGGPAKQTSLLGQLAFTMTSNFLSWYYRVETKAR